MLGRLMSERWWGAWMQQSWRSCEYVGQAGWYVKSMEETAESQRHLYSCITGELLKILLNEAKKTLFLQLLLWNFSGKKGVGAVLAGLWLACTEEFFPISVVSCCGLCYRASLCPSASNHFCSDLHSPMVLKSYLWLMLHRNLMPVKKPTNTSFCSFPFGRVT